MRKLLLFSTPLVVAAALAVAPSARADDPANVREAKMRFQEGLALHDQGHDEEARLKFLEAWAVLKSPNLLFNLARSEQLSGHEVEAMAHYEAYVHSTDPKVADSDRADARSHMAEIAPKVGQITVAAAPGAHVAVDGKSVPGEAPLADPVPVAPGKHTVSAQTSDGVVRTIDVFAGAGAVSSADFTTGQGQTVTPQTSPAATEPAAVPQPPDTTPAPSSAQPFFTPLRTAGVVVAGVGVAALVTGFVFAGQASSASDRASSIEMTLGPSGCASMPSSSPCQSLKSAHDDQTTDHTLNLVFVGVGAAAMVAGAVMLLWPRSSSGKATSAVVEPLVTPQGGGVGLRGVF